MRDRSEKPTARNERGLVANSPTRRGTPKKSIKFLSSNCGGYTLEAELGITPNGYSEPDFLGWEIKQFGVTNFDRITSSVITLMTPEPTDGIYKTKGTEEFLHQYGYADKTGREDRINFGGVHKAGIRHNSTNLEMQLIGYDAKAEKLEIQTVE